MQVAMVAICDVFHIGLFYDSQEMAGARVAQEN
jgi:hypothetical protein